MHPYLIRNSIFISVIIFFTGCSPRPYAHLENAPSSTSCLNQLKPAFTSVLYNAQVNVAGRHLSGLLLFKTMEDGNQRVVFTNEMGITFFDFEFSKNGFQVKSILKKMDKKVVINRLRMDLALLMMHGYDPAKATVKLLGNQSYHRFVTQNEQVYFITDTSCSELNRIETASKRKKKIVVNLTGSASGMPDSVYLAHRSFEYNITLKKITR